MQCSFFLEAPPRFELGHRGFADLCLTTWLWRRIELYALSVKKMPIKFNWHKKNGADDEARTRYLHLGKVALYRMSYIRNCKRDYSKEIWLCQGEFQVFCFLPRRDNFTAYPRRKPSAGLTQSAADYIIQYSTMKPINRRTDQTKITLTEEPI